MGILIVLTMLLRELRLSSARDTTSTGPFYVKATIDTAYNAPIQVALNSGSLDVSLDRGDSLSPIYVRSDNI
jgi:hypothetical protein